MLIAVSLQFLCDFKPRHQTLQVVTEWQRAVRFVLNCIFAIPRASNHNR